MNGRSLFEVFVDAARRFARPTRKRPARRNALRDLHAECKAAYRSRARLAHEKRNVRQLSDRSYVRDDSGAWVRVFREGELFPKALRRAVSWDRRDTYRKMVRDMKRANGGKRVDLSVVS